MALAVALAVRAPRVGHVLVDLATIRKTAVAGFEEEADLAGLPWPPVEMWLDRVSSSPLVTPGDDGRDDRPLGWPALPCTSTATGKTSRTWPCG